MIFCFGKWWSHMNTKDSYRNYNYSPKRRQKLVCFTRLGAVGSSSCSRVRVFGRQIHGIAEKDLRRKSRILRINPLSSIGCDLRSIVRNTRVAQHQQPREPVSQLFIRFTPFLKFATTLEIKNWNTEPKPRSQEFHDCTIFTYMNNDDPYILAFLSYWRRRHNETGHATWKTYDKNVTLSNEKLKPCVRWWKKSLERNCPAYFDGHICKITSEGGYFGYNNSRLMQKPFTGDTGYNFQWKGHLPHPRRIGIKLRLPLVIEQCHSNSLLV